MAEIRARPAPPPDETPKVSTGKRIGKAIFSTLGLCVLVFGYMVGGVYLFKAIEAQQEIDKKAAVANFSQQIEVERAALADTLWQQKLAPNFNTTVESLIEEYHNKMANQISNGYQGVPVNASDFTYWWSWPGAFLFTITVVTTIGYGNIVPVTETGQLVCIFYALVGIPLMLMFLANIGDAMAKAFRIIYGRGCCYLCRKKRRQNYEMNRKAIREMFCNKKGWDPSLPDSKPPVSEAEFAAAFNIDPKNLPEYEVMELEEPEEEVVNVPISLTLVVIATYIFLGAVTFAAWNQWSWITGAYFSFVTLSTIGFGDLVPGWTETGTDGTIKMFASCIYIILGLAVLSMSFNLMMEEMMAKFAWLGRKLGIIDEPKPIDDDDEEEEVLLQSSNANKVAPAAAKDVPKKAFDHDKKI